MVALHPRIRSVLLASSMAFGRFKNCRMGCRTVLVLATLHVTSCEYSALPLRPTERPLLISAALVPRGADAISDAGLATTDATTATHAADAAASQDAEQYSVEAVEARMMQNAFSYMGEDLEACARRHSYWGGDRITVTVQIGGDGVIQSARIAESLSPSYLRCALRVVHRVRFPAFNRGLIERSHEFHPTPPRMPRGLP